MATPSIKEALKPRVTGGTPQALPPMPGVEGVVRSFDPTAVSRALGGVQETFTPGKISYGTPGAVVTKAFGGTKTLERGGTSQMLGEQKLRDIQSQAEAKAMGREQILGEAGKVEGAAAAGAEHVREAMRGYEAAEAERGVEFGELGEAFEEARGMARDVFGRAQELREEQVERTEEIREEGLERIKSPFGLRMNAMLGGLKNQLGRTLSEIDTGLSTGQVDPAAAQQMKQQARMAYGAEVGRMASQLSVEQSRAEAELGFAYDKLTLDTRQAAVSTGMSAELASAKVMATLADSEIMARSSYDNSVRDWELGMGQLALATERMEAAGVELAAEYRTSADALPQAQYMLPVFEYMAMVQEDELQLAMAEAAAGGTSIRTGGKRAAAPWSPGGEISAGWPSITTGTRRPTTSVAPKGKAGPAGGPPGAVWSEEGGGKWVAGGTGATSPTIEQEKLGFLKGFK